MRRGLVGKIFGDLVVIDDLGWVTHSESKVLTRCMCGVVKSVSVSCLKHGDTKSCGCRRVKLVRALKTTHGLTRSGAYRSWTAMRTRCFNPNAINYRDYGGRGVSICYRWESFENFYADMGPRPAGMSLDRIDNNGPYSPENCRWASTDEQHNNQRSSHIITVNGKSLTLTQWSRLINMKRSSLSNRIRRGWSAERAITEPLDNRLSKVES